MAGGKNKRSTQISEVVQKNRATVDGNNQNMFLDHQDKSTGIFDFLTALQLNAKQLHKYFLNLVEILAPLQLLLANTSARDKF